MKGFLAFAILFALGISLIVDRGCLAQSRRLPPFVNAAYGVHVEASNTCGDPPAEYCSLLAVMGGDKSCATCDAADPSLRHPTEYLTDGNPRTWWQSDTMFEGDIQAPNMVNLTLRLGKAFETTYIRIKFHSPRPESLAIYKKTNESSEWQPYQFYSNSCESTYGISIYEVVHQDNQQKALCTQDFSDISPLSGGSVSFSTLEGRPDAYNFANSPALQEFVTATDIRIVLNRLNTFGDEIFGEKLNLQTYYYAISDISIGGREKVL